MIKFYQIFILEKVNTSKIQKYFQHSLLTLIQTILFIPKEIFIQNYLFASKHFLILLKENTRTIYIIFQRRKDNL